jgi:predicted CXXCH cytochrome family protein
VSVSVQLRRVVRNCCLLSAIAFSSASTSLAGNHPPITGQNANCASCHSDMLTGVSVHALGELSCNMCHVAVQQDSGPDVSLAVPKQQVCFNCHERTAMQQHWPQAKRECLDCHDAHRSARAMLLRRDVEVSYKDVANLTNQPPDKPSAKKSTAKLQRKSGSAKAN